MSEAPERIWIEDEFGEGDDDQWTYGTWDVRNYRGYVVEYVRADLALPAVQPVTLVDRDNILAKALWAQSHAKPWDKWERSSPEVKQSFIDGAARVLSALEPAVQPADRIETLTAERDRQYDENAHRIAMQAKAEAERDRLREALEPFAEFARASGFDKLPLDTPMTQGSRLARKQVTVGDFIRARACAEGREP